MRIGVAAHGDPESSSTWSGTPLGIIQALRAQGHDVIGLSATASPRVEKRVQQILALPRMPRLLRGRPRPSIREALAPARAAARVSPQYARLGSITMARSVRAAGELDLVIRMGTSFDLDHPRVVTFEDLTVRQAIDAGWIDWALLPDRARRARNRFQERSFDRAVACTAATPWTASSIVEDYGAAEAKVSAVGIGMNHVPTDAERPWDRPRFLFVGKDWEDKNGPVLLEAFAQLHRDLPDAELHLVGHHPPVERPGVHGHGFLSMADPSARATMSRLFTTATCMVIPTSFEPAGIAHLEAAAAGLPSIGSAAGGAPDIIGPSGVVVTPGDPEALHRALEQMCDLDAARRMGEAGRPRARLFTWDATARRILQAAGASPRDPADWDGLFPGPAAHLA